MNIISLLVALVVFCFLIWAALQLTSAFSIPDPIRTIILVIVVGIALLFLVQMFGVFPLYPVRLR